MRWQIHVGPGALQGNPLRGAAVSDVDVASASICGGGAVGAAAANSENCESGFQAGIPSRQPRSLESAAAGA